MSAPVYMERKLGKEIADKVFPGGVAEKITVTTMGRDEYIAMKMLTRFKELKREDPKKPHPDIGWMLEILEVVRHYEKETP
jgi:hypothetical protein